jgi:3-methyladenine DNA glycosylase AlkD
MNASEILEELRRLGNEGTARVLRKHGAQDPCFGVKVEDLKVLLKKTGRDHNLAHELFRSGVFDAMYLAGLMMDGATMSRAELEEWAATDYGSSISSCTVPWVASEHPDGWALALEWIESDREFVAVAGWSTLSALVSIRPDKDLDLGALATLADRVVSDIGPAKNRVKQAMNQFLIGLGSYVTPLTGHALAAAARVGTVVVDVGDTQCQIPDAASYIARVEARGNLGKKKKTAKC